MKRFATISPENLVTLRWKNAAMGCCCGRAGGTWATDYLSEACLDCKHLVLDTKPLDGGVKDDN